MPESEFAQHIINSIRKELELLKNHNYLQPQAYNDILNLLPKDLSTRSSNVLPSYPPQQQTVNSPPSFGGNMPSPAQSQTSNTSSLPPPPSYNNTPMAEKSLGTAEALYDFHGDNPSTDLSFRCGDIIQLVEFVNNDWWKGTLNGKTGIFPSNYVKKLANTPLNEKRASGPPTPARRDGYGYSPSPQNNSYNNSYGNYTAPPPNPYAPPPQQNYGPPPVQNQVNSYAAPPPVQNQVNSYAPPPVQQVAATGSSAPVAEEQHESKVSSLGKKFAGNVANAATWGFGATIGSDIAHSIF